VQVLGVTVQLYVIAIPQQSSSNQSRCGLKWPILLIVGYLIIRCGAACSWGIMFWDSMILRKEFETRRINEDHVPYAAASFFAFFAALAATAVGILLLRSERYQFTTVFNGVTYSITLPKAGANLVGSLSCAPSVSLLQFLDGFPGLLGGPNHGAYLRLSFSEAPAVTGWKPARHSKWKVRCSSKRQSMWQYGEKQGSSSAGPLDPLFFFFFFSYLFPQPLGRDAGGGGVVSPRRQWWTGDC
jgi:hypothetical protein